MAPEREVMSQLWTRGGISLDGGGSPEGFNFLRFIGFRLLSYLDAANRLDVSKHLLGGLRWC